MADPIFRGMLWKKGHVRRNWKIRLFILYADKLQYFEQEGMVKKGELALAGEDVRITTSDELQRQGVRGAVPKGTIGPTQRLRFVLKAGAHSIMMGAKNEDLLRQWMDKFAQLEAEGRVRSFATTYTQLSDEGSIAIGDGGHAEAAVDEDTAAAEAAGAGAGVAPPPLASEGKERGRMYSVMSKAAIDKLTTLDQKITGIERRIGEIYERAAALSSDAEELLTMKDELAQLNGTVERLQCVEVDGVVTGELNSGKADARAQRKELNRTCDMLHGTIADCAKHLQAKIAGEEPAAPAVAAAPVAAAAADATPKGGKNKDWDSGGVAQGDAKDLEDFEYLTYPACPQWTDKHRSLMAKHCTPEMFEKLKDVTTETGYTFHNAIQTGTETPHLGVGITAGDEDSYDKFKDIIYPIIAGWHGGYDAATQTHPTDLDPAHLNFSAEQRAKFDAYVVSTRIRAARNIRGFPLPPGSTRESAAGVEDVLKKTFAGLEGDLKGTYYPLGGMDEATESDLQSQGFLFQKPKTTNLLTNAGAARYWPESRGIFHNDNKTALCWCNEEDHCRIISMAMKGDVMDVFARFCSLSEAMKSAAVAAGADLMHSDNLGFIGTCPSNLGTGLRASVMVKLEKLNENVELLEKVCEKFDLQPRGSAGEHSAAVGGKWDVSNKQRIGFSEVQLVQKMIDGVAKLIAIEERLAGGATAADIVDSL